VVSTPGREHANKLDAKPETKKRNKYALNPKNKDGIDSKWQHSGKRMANTQVDDGTGKGTTVRLCVKASRIAANKRGSCITCNAARRTQGRDKCNPQSVCARVHGRLVQHAVQAPVGVVFWVSPFPLNRLPPPL
jgi:hypothetical protein